MPLTAYLLSDSPYLKMKEAETTTTDEGFFEFIGLQPGSYVIRRAEEEGIHGEVSREVRISVGAFHEGLDFPVTRGATLTGTVYWGTTPAADVEFNLHYAHVGDDISKTQAQGAKLLNRPVSTEIEGRYLVSGVQDMSGVLYVTVTLTNGDTRMSRWERNVTISDGEYKTVDFHFDVGTASIEGQFARGGQPIPNALVIWYPERVNYGERRTRTDEEGWYRLEGVVKGEARVHFYYPRSYESVGRSIFTYEKETLVLDVDIPLTNLNFDVKNVPENMKSAWIYISIDDGFLSKNTSYRNWLETTAQDVVAKSRILVGSRSNARVRLWGVGPGTYRMAAISYPTLGYFGSYIDDVDKITEFLEGTVVVYDTITIEESGNPLEIDFAGGKPGLDYFTTELE